MDRHPISTELHGALALQRQAHRAQPMMRPVFRQARWSAAGLLAPPYGKFIDRALQRLVR